MYNIRLGLFETNSSSTHTIVIMKKEHPCKSNEWEITRMGADIKIKCIKCGRSIMFPRIEFNKKLKKVIQY